MSSSTYRFGAFRLDPARRELWRGDEELALPPKAFGCLVYLVEHRDRAVGRDELIEAVWHKDNLADSVLGQAIVDARRVLDDNSEEHHYIQTVRGFGYRWAAPVEVVEASTEVGAMPARRSRRLWLLVAALGLAVLAAAMLYLRHGGEEEAAPSGTAWQRSEGDIALLLPVTVEPEDRHSWIRFGVMELIAERLREAGQPMVPSETVIALTRGLPAEPGPEGLDSLTSTTGARLVLGAHAQAVGARWRVSVRSLDRDQPPLTALAESADVLDAARVAADRVALALGLTPAPEPNSEPGLATLLRQVEAAMLAQKMDVARALIESADARWREHPEVRLLSAWIHNWSHDLDAAQAAYESLLEEPAVKRDSGLRARVSCMASRQRMASRATTASKKPY